MTFDLRRRLAAEALGTGALVLAIVGSGIVAEHLAGDPALVLLANTLVTGAALAVLITIFGPVSGAHFNPAVTLVFLLRRTLGVRSAAAYIGVQMIGGVAGVLLAHAMFELPFPQLARTVRTGHAQWLAELVATFGLIITILAALRFRQAATPWLVGLYIAAACWFTVSTAFANPAVTVARAFTDTFAGIRPIDVSMFAIAQCGGALLAVLVAGWLFGHRDRDRLCPPAPG